MNDLMARLPDMLRKNARQDAEEGEYHPSEHIEWMAADEIECLRAALERIEEKTRKSADPSAGLIVLLNEIAREALRDE